jgi:NADH pyrophosphatase NudC (nudix superfamily)
MVEVEPARIPRKGGPRAHFCIRCSGGLSSRHDGERDRLTCAVCGWVFYDNPLPVVAGLVMHEGEVILVQNQGWPAAWFGLVTGFLERGEDPLDGLKREISEELGLEVVSSEWIGTYPFPQRNEVILAWQVNCVGEVVQADELAAIKRVPLAKLRPWPIATGLAVRDWLARHPQGEARPG